MPFRTKLVVSSSASVGDDTAEGEVKSVTDLNLDAKLRKRRMLPLIHRPATLRRHRKAIEDFSCSIYGEANGR
jgi:hypothetical protein